MIQKDINQITEEDLQRLVDNAVVEGKTIEYKQDLPDNSDSNKKEFLADVSSFANTSGGDLIYGIAEDKGLPLSVEGLNIENIDQLTQKLDSIIRDGIRPRIPSITIKPICLANSKLVLIIRILKSWISPHRVEYKKHHKFYSRSSNGKYQMDVEELRVSFNLSATIKEKIHLFKLDRISKINADETPIALNEGAKTVLHLIPISSFSTLQQFDIEKIASNPLDIKPICFHYSGSHRYNLEGLLFSAGPSSYIDSYVQLYRNGVIEAVDGPLLQDGNQKRIACIAFEGHLIKGVERYVDALKKLGVDPPILIFLTLLNVNEYKLETSYSMSIEDIVSGSYAIDRNILFLPEVIIENYPFQPASVLKPCFDAIWQACGKAKCLDYDSEGKWKHTSYLKTIQ